MVDYISNEKNDKVLDNILKSVFVDDKKTLIRASKRLLVLKQKGQNLQKDLQKQQTRVRKTWISFWAGILSFFGFPILMSLIFTTAAALPIVLVCVCATAMFFIGKASTDYLISTTKVAAIKKEIKQNAKDYSNTKAIIKGVQKLVNERNKQKLEESVLKEKTAENIVAKEDSVVDNKDKITNKCTTNRKVVANEVERCF